MRDVQVTNHIGWQTKINTGKKPIIVKLEDGSVITLYTNTVVKYPQPFAGNSREIILSGDAFFEVAKNTLKPFVVHSGNLSTSALQTSFRSNLTEKIQTQKLIEFANSLQDLQRQLL